MYKIEMPVEILGSLNFRPLRINDLRSSLFTTFTSTVMICPAGLKLNDRVPF